MPQNEWHMTDGNLVTVVTDPSIDISDAQLRSAFQSNPELRALGDWVSSIKSTASEYSQSGSRPQRTGGLFERDRYVNPRSMFDQFKVAKDAAENDDIVSSVIESTEALVFNKVRIECGDDEEENIWDQIVEDMELDLRLREMWRDLFIFSQYYVASYWEEREYGVQGVKNERKARKRFNVNMPVSLSLLDPMKVVPMGDALFGKEKLIYLANNSETSSIDDVVAGKNTTDLVIDQLIDSKYEPEQSDLTLLQQIVGPTKSLGRDGMYVLDPNRCWRHTATSPSYQRFAPVRMTSIFELLDLKHQLRQQDRATLIGATNFIVLVKKGTDQHPAQQEEMAALANSVRTVARTPLIVGDHRLSVEIITPPMDGTLEPKRYNNIDSRITARLYQIFHVGGFSAGVSGDDSLKLARVVARGLESRRQAIKRNFEKNLLLPAWEANPNLKNKPSLAFTPRQVALDFDPNFINLMRDLFMSGNISRETMLGIVDIEQEDEAVRREIESEKYDDLFPERDMSPGQKGRIGGGNKKGGGLNPDSMVPNPVPRRPASDIPEVPSPEDDE